MELTQDWRGLQKTFYPPRRDSLSGQNPLYFIEDRGVILSAYAEGEDLSEWVGMTVVEMKAQFPHRTLVAASQEQVKGWLGQILSEGHVPSQLRQVRSLWSDTLPAEVRSKGSAALPGRLHFLIDSLERSWWAKVLPSAFAVLLRLESEADSPRDFILVYRKGRLEQYGEPDLSFLSDERKQDLADVSRYLSERLSVPVQAVQMLDQDWKAWSEQSHPWKEIAWAIQSKRVQLVPFRWQWVGLVATRGFIGL